MNTSTGGPLSFIIGALPHSSFPNDPMPRSPDDSISMIRWRTVVDRAKRSPLALRVADRLGRSRGRLRLLDHLTVPPPPPRVPDLSDWHRRGLSAVWIGHATVLLRVHGRTVLTDPVFSTTVGVGLGLFTLGATRMVAPAVPLRDLPPVDLVLVSHAHFDHLDRPTLARLPRRTPVVTAAGTGDLLRDLGLHRVVELPWGRRFALGDGLTVTAHPVDHWGARVFYDAHRGYNAYVVDAPGHRVLYGGDTAYTRAFRGVGPVDLAVLGIGAYDPYIAAHASPEQAWAMANDARAGAVLPVHHRTFRLSHEPVDEPIERLLAAAGRDAGRVVAENVGDEWSA